MTQKPVFGEEGLTPRKDQDKLACCNCKSSYCTCGFSGLSWKAIFAGALVAIGISFLFDLFGMGIGSSAYTAAKTSAEAKAFAYGGYLAIIISGMVAMFAAGWIAGFIARPWCKTFVQGIIHGFLAWCLALVLSFFLIGHASQLISTQYNLLTGTKNVEIYTNKANNPAFNMTANEERHSTNRTSGTVNIDSEKVAKEAAKGFFLLFLLFFTGALAAAFGGYTAVKKCDKFY